MPRAGFINSRRCFCHTSFKLQNGTTNIHTQHSAAHRSTHNLQINSVKCFSLWHNLREFRNRAPFTAAPTINSRSAHERCRYVKLFIKWNWAYWHQRNEDPNREPESSSSSCRMISALLSTCVECVKFSFSVYFYFFTHLTSSKSRNSRIHFSPPPSPAPLLSLNRTKWNVAWIQNTFGCFSHWLCVHRPRSLRANEKRRCEPMVA